MDDSPLQAERHGFGAIGGSPWVSSCAAQHATRRCCASCARRVSSAWTFPESDCWRSPNDY